MHMPVNKTGGNIPSSQVHLLFALILPNTGNIRAAKSYVARFEFTSKHIEDLRIL